MFDRILELGMLASHRRAPTSPSISLPPLEPAEQVDKSRRQRRLDDVGCRGAKDVADRGQHNVVDVFGFVG
jgi:hypothetical protein